MRKQRIHAGFVARIVVYVLEFLVLARHCIIGVNRYGAERITVPRSSVSQYRRIHHIRQRTPQQRSQEKYTEEPAASHFASCVGHEKR